MLQHNQIGKYKNKQSVINAKLNQVYVTPNGERYSLIKFEKIGNKRHYIYQWLDMPKEYLNVIKKGTCTFLHEARLEEIINFIEQVKQTYKENY